MTTFPGVDSDLSGVMQAVFAKHAAAGEQDASVFDGALWEELTGLGLARLTGSEDSGGSGAGWLEAAELLSAAAASGVRAPLAEHDLLACSLLEAAGLPVDDRLRTLAEVDVDGLALAVAWARCAQRLVLVWPAGGGWLVADVDPSGTTEIVPGTNVIGEPRDGVSVDLGAVQGTPIEGSLVEQHRRKGAVARAVQVCAALDRALALSCEHATTRHQFGRPLSRFQAVQHLIADMAAECALARAATEAALAAAMRTDWAGDEVLFRIAVARSCAGHAATTVVRNAHQVHGAIGTAIEHDLHRFTRAALAWRAEFGSVDQWDRRLAAIVRDAGSDGLWSLIAD
ncbi:acyl-CoA dehydrogenase family protein [Flexivirga caeni]|uniref:Acyl-CoA dehydrogenase n=1 Tax=Flexivirga caeni TaxID=2294115 RepID=A0A3M9M7Z7_9MICO|nr:acyl-CoA dehydrogenase family protein [Flexivirga caeni]RNI20668.1 acyl-CoA dehydrogenase [Flexivirga caeni]